jgi:glycerophosphoryl diester phosphodiesterase
MNEIKKYFIKMYVLLKKKKLFKILIAFLLISLYIFILSIIGNSNIIIKRHPHDIFSPSHKTFIESHRGVNREIFQNTLESFKKVIDYNIESIETDTWLSKDNILIILHGSRDSHLKGYYNYWDKATKLTWKELSSYRTIRNNLKMPRLSDLFELAKNKLFINLEIKDPRIDIVFPKLIELIEKYDFFDQISLSSYFFGYYNKIEEYNKQNHKNLTFGFLYFKTKEIYYNYSHKGSSLNLYWIQANKRVCDKAHKNGMAVMAWFLLSDRENDKIYKKLIENGVDVICSNEPVKAKKFRDNYYNNLRYFFVKMLSTLYK